MRTAYLGLGSNLNDRAENLGRAISILYHHMDIRLKKVSRFYEMDAVSFAPQPSYLNAVIEIATSLSAEDLLKLTQSIEKQMGRTQKGQWQARNIDIDILLMEDEMLCSEDLNIPHLGLADREFVLFPLKEIAPDLMHPILQKTITELYDELPLDVLVENELETQVMAQLVASCALPGDILLLHGELGSGKTTFVRYFSEHLKAKTAVSSPTFTLIQTYPGELPIVHADLYRLNTPKEVAGIDLDSHMDAHSVTVVEWAERMGNPPPKNALQLWFHLTEMDVSQRLIRIAAQSEDSQPFLSRIKEKYNRVLV